jgi:hypothetical protein
MMVAEVNKLVFAEKYKCEIEIRKAYSEERAWPFVKMMQIYGRYFVGFFLLEAFWI